MQTLHLPTVEPMDIQTFKDLGSDTLRSLWQLVLKKTMLESAPLGTKADPIVRYFYGDDFDSFTSGTNGKGAWICTFQSLMQAAGHMNVT